MSNIFGREVGVINESPKHTGITRLVWLDLSAGDGAVVDGTRWWSNCSPGIAAYHATKSRKPVVVQLHEIKAATFDRLIERLTVELPALGYSRISERTWCFRSISTMGCNVGGLLRLDAADRAGWFDLIKQQEAALPAHRDLLLAAIEGDASKWAYLFSEPVAWRRSVDRSVTSAFAKYGYSLDLAWYREDGERFEQAKSGLFLTKKERGEVA